MGDNSKIEMTDASWNPIRGCSMVSDGCANCYAMRQAHRLEPYKGLTRQTEHGPVWTGEVRLVPKLLDQPLRWKCPRRIFVNSMSDLFHESVPDEFIMAIVGTMVVSPSHIFQILTKRPARMRDFFRRLKSMEHPAKHCVSEMIRLNVAARICDADYRHWPMPTLWLGVSVEDQKTADERVPLLCQTPAAIRWISAEPLLGPIDLCKSLAIVLEKEGFWECRKPIDWVVLGGESGPRARPMHPDWARSIRDQCRTAGVPFFFKQWGEWMPDYGGVISYDLIALFNKADNGDTPIYLKDLEKDRRESWAEYQNADDVYMSRVGKKAAGHLLDGKEWREFPK